MIEFSYKNASSSMVVLKCIGANRFFFERVIFPEEILTFMAPQASQVEIWGIQSYGPKLEKRMRVSLVDDQIAA